MVEFRVLDLFAGCGGASYGFKLAEVPGSKVQVVRGIDIDPHCCSTFRRMLNAPCEQADVRQLADNLDELGRLQSLWSSTGPDVRKILIGCAPCQGFAAHRKAVEGRDARRSLFGAMCEIAAALKPDGIFIENVPDLLARKHWPHFRAGRDLLMEAGYVVRGRVYNFADFGLPQERFRTVVLAARRPFNMPVPPLTHYEHRTVRDAIAHLPPLAPGEVSSGDPMHQVSKHRAQTVDILRQVPRDGGNRPLGVGPKCLDRARELHGGYTDVYGRLAWDKPAVTITARCRTPSCGRFAHPEQNRGLSIREAALLQGFPANFVFEGPFDDKYKQIGNAVPPLVARQFAEHLIRSLINPTSLAMSGLEDDVSAPVGPGFAVTINGIKRRRMVGKA